MYLGEPVLPVKQRDSRSSSGRGLGTACGHNLAHPKS
eukprot:CAMPEP_0119387372 /NCGR_PEP_ID=MMETSP1334-20130426/100378_1 /TAXON_ID=127549 /ORGANISM="Calcidiscus leptoporus, Strain RCC1130" /LENGTH=36 /DNA_ID= /DNA_START= /DNA_END= /DNA_ORIENTATION=